jgi:hypothetical protein
MSSWAWFAEGFAAGVLLIGALIWLVSAVVRIELAERERERERRSDA